MCIRDRVEGLNRLVAAKFEEVFGLDHRNPYSPLSIPVVPTLGNNDVLPHNIFNIGPNSWTKTYLDIWRKFIPEEQRHQFDQGGWFSVEVIPKHLVVFSLNSLYFFDSNAAVDGCSLREEPGYRQFEWLRIQLDFLRMRGMKAIVMGHVPPAHTSGKRSWDETCWQKYALWTRQYRDVIVGGIYGHMNFDHFMLQDFDEIDPSLEKGYGIETRSSKAVVDDEEEIGITSATSYFTDLRAMWKKLPKMPTSMRKRDVETQISDMSDDARPDWEIESVLSLIHI